MITGVDLAGGEDVTVISIIRVNSPEFAPIITGDVEQMIADIDRVEITRRSEKDRFDELVAAIDLEIAADYERMINVVLNYW